MLFKSNQQSIIILKLNGLSKIKDTELQNKHVVQLVIVKA